MENSNPRSNNYSNVEGKAAFINDDSFTDAAIKKIRALAYYWFVQYNPFYFFSALCVLIGVYLISKDLNSIKWPFANLLLAAVLQLYELLLIVGGAVLFRFVNNYRPAVILVLIEILFFFDPTFEVEALSTSPPAGLLTIVAWVVLAAIKLSFLSWAFKLKADRAFLSLPVLGAVGLAGASKLMALGVVDREIVHLSATWYFAALIAIVLRTRPVAVCSMKLDGWGNIVLQRVIKTAWIVWAGIYLIHLLSWIGLFDLNLSLAHAAPFILLCPFISTKEGWTWAGSIGAIAASCALPQTISLTALMAALALIWAGSYTKNYRFWTGAVMAFYLSCWTIDLRGWPLPEPQLWLNAATAIVLLLMAWRLRIISPLSISLALALFQTGRYGKSLGTLGWGVLLLTIGFISLVIGVYLNWKWPKAVSKEQ
jgi:hypothetical protein